MTVSKTWAVEIHINEEDEQRRTFAEARLHTEGEVTDVRGTGVAWRNPHDSDVPEIGDELAAARALSDVATKLRETAAADIGQRTDEPVWLSR